MKLTKEEFGLAEVAGALLVHDVKRLRGDGLIDGMSEHRGESNHGTYPGNSHRKEPGLQQNLLDQ